MSTPDPYRYSRIGDEFYLPGDPIEYRVYRRGRRAEIGTLVSQGDQLPVGDQPGRFAKAYIFTATDGRTGMATSRRAAVDDALAR